MRRRTRCLAWVQLPVEAQHGIDDRPPGPGKFGSDIAYGEAALAYERRAGRHPIAKDAAQPGYDIDSFDRRSDSTECRLVRRVEVKGRGSR